MYDYKLWSWTEVDKCRIEFQEFVADDWEPYLMAGDAQNLVVMFRRPSKKVV